MRWPAAHHAPAWARPAPWPAGRSHPAARSARTAETPGSARRTAALRQVPMRGHAAPATIEQPCAMVPDGDQDYSACRGNPMNTEDPVQELLRRIEALEA